MLSCAGLRDHALLAHALGDQSLADRIVDLVRAGVIEVFALEPDLSAASLLGQSLGVIDRARTSHIVLEFVCELGLELRIVAHAQILAFEFVQRMHERFSDEHAAVGPEVATAVR
jgi:hypothetical protein